MKRQMMISVGPFAKAKKDADAFCQNLFLSHTMVECAKQMSVLQKEYDEALLRDDEEAIEMKKLQLQAFQSSFMLTAQIFNEIDEIST